MFFNEAQKVIWFTQDKDGHQVLHRPDGTNAKGKEKYEVKPPMTLLSQEVPFYAVAPPPASICSIFTMSGLLRTLANWSGSKPIAFI